MKKHILALTALTLAYAPAVLAANDMVAVNSLLLAQASTNGTSGNGAYGSSPNDGGMYSGNTSGNDSMSSDNQRTYGNRNNSGMDGTASNTDNGMKSGTRGGYGNTGTNSSAGGEAMDGTGR